MNNFDDLSQDIFEEDDVINSAAGGILPAGSGPTGGLFKDGSSEEASQEGEQSASDPDETELTSLSGDTVGQEQDDEISGGDADDDPADQGTTQIAGTESTSAELTGQRVIQTEAGPTIASPASSSAPAVSSTVLQVSAAEMNAGAAAPAAGSMAMLPDSGPVDPGAISAPDLGAPAAPVSLATLAQYLNDSDAAPDDFWDEFGVATSPYFNLTTSGSNAKSGTIHYNVTGFSGIAGAGTDTNGVTAARADMIRHALNIYEDILGINFVETTSTSTAIVDIYFKDNVAGKAFANFSGQAASGAIQYGYVNIAAAWSGGTSNIGSYSFQTALHEIGHVLGLGHQGLYNAGSGSPTYNDAYWQNDTWQQTMMSYWDQTNYNSQSYAELIGPMAVDWLALENLYGGQGYGVANGATTGNTTWGFNSSWIDWTPSSSGPAFGYSNTAYASMDTLLATNAVAIVDGGGIDTLDLSGFSNNTVIDVSEALATSTSGSISSVAGKTGNLTIAVGTIIENVIGGSGNELIYGNNAANNIDGNGGDDTIYGYNGNDTLIGDSGNDYLSGGSGVDSILGGSGDDTILAGGTTGDFVDGGSGNDIIYGGLNGQTLLGGSGQDTIYGDDATPTSGVGDTIDGGGGNDYILGANGGDWIKGGSGADTLLGSGGNDTIEGGFSTDSVNGGAGNDLIRVLTGEYYDSVDGGLGDDTLDHSTSNYSGDVFNFQTGVLTAGLSHMSGGTATLINIETYLDGTGANTIYSDGSGLFSGGGGNDTIYAGLGTAETLDGGTGTDLLDTTNWNGAYVINMTTGVTSYGESFINFENLITGGGNDSITGSSGANVIDGGAGNDTLEGGSGVDTLYGGAGNDTFLQVNGWTGGDTYDGGTGTDTLDYSGTSGYNSTANLSTGTLTGSGAAITLVSIENILAGNGADTLTGSSVANVLNGGDGNDSINGGAGNDTLLGGDGNDTLEGGSGVDTLFGDGGNDTFLNSGGNFIDDIDGGAGTDTLDMSGYTYNFLTADLGAQTYTVGGGAGVQDLISVENVIGTANNDSITGALGDNVLMGGAGNDTLDGSDGSGAFQAGLDTLEGGAGDDVLRYSMGGTGSSALSTYDGGAGIDTFEVTSATLSGRHVDLAAGQFQLSVGGSNRGNLIGIENVTVHNNTSVNGDANANVITGVGNFANSFSGGDGKDTIYGGDGNDTLLGEVGGDKLYGGDGNDSVVGAGGNDKLYGHDGADKMYGGSGKDKLYGGSGNDKLYGGNGSDTVNGGTGNDKLFGGSGDDVLNGHGGHDTLEGGSEADTMDGGTGTDKLSYAASDAAVTVDLGLGTASGGHATGDVFSNFENAEGSAHNDVLTGDGIGNQLAGLGGDDTISGGAGQDTIYGNDGNDVLYGDSGADVMGGGNGDDYVSGGTYSDTLTGGSGNDTLHGGSGHDVISGGNNNDVIIGANGSDTLTGGNGLDDFIFEDFFGTDTITDFSSHNAEDIDLSGVTAIIDFNDLISNHLVNSGGFAQIVVGGNSILLDGVAFGDVGFGELYSASDFIFV